MIIVVWSLTTVVVILGLFLMIAMTAHQEEKKRCLALRDLVDDKDDFIFGLKEGIRVANLRAMSSQSREDSLSDAAVGFMRKCNDIGVSVGMGGMSIMGSGNKALKEDVDKEWPF